MNQQEREQREARPQWTLATVADYLDRQASSWRVLANQHGETVLGALNHASADRFALAAAVTRDPGSASDGDLSSVMIRLRGDMAAYLGDDAPVRGCRFLDFVPADEHEYYGYIAQGYKMALDAMAYEYHVRAMAA